MSRHFKNIHVGKSTVAVTGLGKSTVPAPLKIKIDPTNEEATTEIVQWGSDNLYPQNFYNKKFLKNGAAVGGISILKSTHHGNGFKLYKEEEDSSTGEIIVRNQILSKYPEIKLFVRDNKLDKFWFEKITDQSLFQIAFTEHVLSANQETIVRVKRQKAAHCRFAKMDDSGRIPFVYINTDWSNANKEYSVPIPFMDGDMTALEIKEYCKAKKIYNFITATYYPLVDENYYPKADWHAVDRSGWMDVANSVPELKQALFENQMHFKYIVYVSDLYFESFYKEEWDDFDAEKRQKMREDLSTAIDDHMSGNNASGRSLIAPIFEENGKFAKGIEIEPVDNKLKDGSYLPDASAANSEILFAIGVNPAIIGAGTPGASNLGGSGSNIREAYTVLSASLVPRRNTTLEDWALWRDFNGWDTDLEAGFPNVNLTTLDKNPNGQVEIMNG
jgi:hypothetical protein